jgi:hypothetical protein
MNELRITVDGMPLEDVLASEESKEIAQHLTTEVRTIAKQCGVRRSSSTPHQRLGRPGRPQRGISLALLYELEPYLRDEECRINEIADLFGMSAHDVRFYQRWLQIQRKRGRKSRYNERRVPA